MVIKSILAQHTFHTKKAGDKFSPAVLNFKKSSAVNCGSNSSPVRTDNKVLGIKSSSLKSVAIDDNIPQKDNTVILTIYKSGIKMK